MGKINQAFPLPGFHLPSYARAVVKTINSHMPRSPTQKSLLWLKIHEQIQYIHNFSLIIKFSPLLSDLISVQPSRSTRSSTVLTLLRPSVSSSLKVKNHSFCYSSPHLWNYLLTAVYWQIWNWGNARKSSCPLLHSLLLACLPPQNQLTNI